MPETIQNDVLLDSSEPDSLSGSPHEKQGHYALATNETDVRRHGGYIQGPYESAITNMGAQAYPQIHTRTQTPNILETGHNLVTSDDFLHKHPVRYHNVRTTDIAVIHVMWTV